MEAETPILTTPPELFVTKKRSPIILLIAIAAPVILVGIFVLLSLYYLPVARPVQGVVSALFFPTELKGAMILSEEGGSTYEYIHRPLLLNRAQVSDEYVTHYVSRSGAAVASVARAPGGSDAILLNGIPIHTSSSHKSTVSVNPGASKVAFTEEKLGVQEVTVLTVGTKNQIHLGEGHTPLFLDATHVLWFTKSGATVTDISSGAVAIVPGSVSVASTPAPVLSPDATHVAWINKDTAVVSLYQVSGGVLELVRTYPVSSAGTQFSLANNALFLFTHEPSGAQLWKYSFNDAQAKKVLNFPANMTITQLIP